MRISRFLKRKKRCQKTTSYFLMNNFHTIFFYFQPLNLFKQFLLVLEESYNIVYGVSLGFLNLKVYKKFQEWEQFCLMFECCINGVVYVTFIGHGKDIFLQDQGSTLEKSRTREKWISWGVRIVAPTETKRVRCQLSGRCQVPGVRCQVSGVRCRVSCVRCHMALTPTCVNLDISTMSCKDKTKIVRQFLTISEPKLLNLRLISLHIFSLMSLFLLVYWIFKISKEE